MMLLPLTAWPSFSTLISERYLPASWTNFTAARAWSPSLFRILCFRRASTSALLPHGHLTGQLRAETDRAPPRVAQLLRERRRLDMAALDRGELHQHREVHAAEHL